MSGALSQLVKEIANSDFVGIFALDSAELLDLLRLPPASAQRLQRLFEHFGASTLDDIRVALRHQRAPIPAAEQHALCMDIGRAVGGLRQLPARQPARRVDPSAFESEDDFRAWARERGVEQRLEDPASLLVAVAYDGAMSHFVRGQGIRYTVLDLLLYRVSEQHLKPSTQFAYGGPGVVAERAKRMGVAWLQYCATEQKQREADEAGLRELLATTDAKLDGPRRFVELLRWLQETVEGGCSPPGLWAVEHYTFEGQQLRGYFRHATTYDWLVGEAHLGFSAWERGRLAYSCSCAPASRREAPCAHVGAALEMALRDVLLQRGELWSFISVPSWKRLLRSIDGAVERRVEQEQQAATRRLAWRVESYSGFVTPLLQKVSKNGKFTRGRQVHPAELMMQTETLELSANERAALEQLASPGGWVAPLDSFRALKLLRDHPRLQTESGRQRVAVREVQLSIQIEECSGGYELRTFLGDLPLSAPEIASLAGRGHHVVHLDEDACCRLCELNATSSAMVRTLACSGDFIPAHVVDELVRRLPQLQEHVDIALPQQLLGRRIESERGLVVRLTQVSEGALDVAVRVRPIAAGPTLEPGGGVSRLVSGSRGRRVHVLRDLAEERARATELLSSAAFRDTEARGAFERRIVGLDGMIAVLALLKDRPELRLEWQGELLELSERLSLGGLLVKVGGKGGLLEVSGVALSGEEEAELALLLDAARNDRKWVQLSPRRFACLEQELLSALERLLELTQSKGKNALVSPAFAPLLAEVLKEIEVEDTGALDAAVERAKRAAALKPRLPRSLARVLRPYQAEGFKWLARLASWGVGACLADDMGLGKTLQCLALLLFRKKEGPALVLAPTSVADNWWQEAKRFAPELDVRIYRGSKRAALLQGLGPCSVVVASYDIATRDVDELSKHQFATLVLDEAQAVKNAHTQRAQAVRLLNASFRVALTGTPIENHVGELWSLFRVLEPGLLGSWELFSARFARPIELEGSQSRLEALRRLVQPFILRRTKAEVLPELPERVELVRAVALSKGERMMYETARLAALERAKAGGPEARMEVLAAITRLRRLVCHPRLYDEASTLESSKLELMLELMHELREEGRRALIFSQFTSFLDLALAKLEAAGFSFQHLDGSTPAADRARRVEAFQAGEGDAFLISLKAGGTGLNLTGADTVILLDPWWNPAVEDQAADRAHRFGQQRGVTIIRIVASGTIEDAVLAMHADKRDLAQRLLSGTDMGARITTEDMIALLGSAASAQSMAGGVR